METSIPSKPKNNGFYKKYFAIVLPLIAQQFVYISLNFIDNIMVGQLGEANIAGVGFANKLYFIFILVIFGAFGGSTIFMSQYYGKRDMNGLRKIFAIVVGLALFVGIGFMILSTIFASNFMWMFSNDQEVVGIGTKYLVIVAMSFPFTAISFAITSALRSMGKTKQALYIVIVATSVNTVLNYCLIYGNLGFPRLEAEGAAIATAIARFIEFLACLYLFANRKYHLRTTFKRYFWLSKKTVKSLIKISIPVFFTESIWVIATTLLYVAYGQLGTLAGASVNIAELIINMGSIIFFGVALGANILIAQTIGAGKLEEAFDMAKKIFKMAVALSLAVSVLAILIRGLILKAYTLTPEAIAMTDKVLIAFSIAMFFKFINWTVIVGILRSGGDTTAAFFIDVIPIVFLAIPIAFYCAVVLKMEIHWVVIIANAEEVIKMIVALWRFKSKKWIKNLTNN